VRRSDRRCQKRAAHPVIPLCSCSPTAAGELRHSDQYRQLEQCYWYCLGLASQRFGVVVHAGCLMSTHSHEVVTDVQGVLPRFLQEFHRLLALTTKALRGWPGEVFDKRSTGQHALARDIGTRVIEVERPSHYFDSDNPAWPEVVELELRMPTELELDYGIELTQQRIADRVREREHRAWQESKRTGIAFLGVRRVLRQAHTKRARSYEVFGSLNLS